MTVEARRSTSTHKRLRVTAQKWQAKMESPERGAVGRVIIVLSDRRAC